MGAHAQSRGWCSRRSRGPSSSALCADPAFRAKLEALVASAPRGPGGADVVPARARWRDPHRVAYFSMEFGLSEALPIYSGGLGNVAGDQLKAASDLGVPVIGIGILYQEGYFRQVIDADGSQRALYPHNNPGQLPITPGPRRGRRVAAPSCHPARLPRVDPGVAGQRRAAPRSTCSTATTRQTRRTCEGSPASSTAAAPRCAWPRSSILGIAGWRLLGALGLSPPGVPPQRRACRLRRPGARGDASWRRAASRSRLPSRPPAQATSSPRTRRWRPASTVLRPR